MKVFVAGATGVLGYRLVSHLSERGHDVHGLARDDDGAALVEQHGGTPRRGDLLEPETLESAVDDDVEVIVHAATHFPIEVNFSEEDLSLNDRIRKEGTKNLLAAAGEDFERFVFPSVVWVARQPDGSFFAEDAERHPDRGTRSAAEVEEYLLETAETADFDVTILRNGYFYAPDAGHTRIFGKRLLDGDLPVVGRGLLGRKDAALSFVHVEDAARALADAIDAEVSGLYHVVDDEPVTAADLYGELADLLGAPEPSRVPAWLARFFVGKLAADLLSKPYPTTSEKFEDATGWEPEYATYREGLEHVVETWEEEGIVRRAGGGYEWNGPVEPQ